MKIQATYTDDSFLLQYVGKDAWILCKALEGIEFEDFYLRIITHHYGDHYAVNIMTQSDIAELNKFSPDIQLSIINKIFFRDLKKTTISTPLTIKTTEDLFPDLWPHQDILDRYVGKDAWILVTDYTGDTEQDIYVKLVTRKDNVYTCRFVEGGIIDGDPEYWDGVSDEDVYSDLTRSFARSVGSLKVVIPKEVYSTAEIFDLIGAAYASVQESGTY